MDLCVSAKDTSSSLAAETWLQSQRSLNGLALNGSAPLNILSLNKRSLTREGFVMLLCCFAVIGAAGSMRRGAAAPVASVSDGACFCSRLRSSLNGILDHPVILGNNDVIDHTARHFQFLIPPAKFLSLVILQIIEAHIVFFVINKSQFNPQCMTIQFVDCPPPPKPPSLLYLGVKRKGK